MNPGGSGVQLAKVELARYEWAARFVVGKEVLDSGCGHGWGSYLLARSAKTVVGVDPDIEAIAYARENVHAPNLTFSDIAQLRGRFDAVVSLEVIEHIEDPRSYLDSLHDILKDDGDLLLSTPNKQFTEKKNLHNPFHLHEFYPDELESLIKERFHVVSIEGQPSGESRMDSLAPYAPMFAKKLWRKVHRPPANTEGLDSDSAVQLVHAIRI
jgi:cyclopropane fatty-acyl-phospholipid synthase-like methyltransferase